MGDSGSRYLAFRNSVGGDCHSGRSGESGSGTRCPDRRFNDFAAAFYEREETMPAIGMPRTLSKEKVQSTSPLHLFLCS